MSELSAKHEALTILRILTSEKNPRTSTSPRPDLAGSQEVLAGKYQELAALLANQYVERKTVARLQRVDLIARKTNRGPSRRRQDLYHDKPVRRKHRIAENKLKRANIPQDEMTSSGFEKETESDLDSKKPQRSQIRSKKVSFSDIKSVRTTDDDCSSNTSDTEIIRRILRSPRRVTTEMRLGTSQTGERGKSSPTGAKQKPRRKLRKVKKSVEETPKKTSDCSSKRETLESPREKKEFEPTDTKLSSSSNPDVLSWLKDKNKLIRRHRRSERKKERSEKLAEQKAAEEKTRRLAESEDNVAQWMKLKKDESIMKWKVERKVRRELKLRESLSPCSIAAAPNERPSLQLETSGRQNKSKADYKNKPHTSDRGAPCQSSLDESHHIVQDLAAERLQAEEKRQKRKAEKRQKRLLKEAQTVKDTKKIFTQPSVSTSTKTSAEDNTGTKPDIESKGNASGDNRRNHPSSNPFKGMTYDEWVRQKQADNRKQAKEAKKQEVGDPELDELIPVLARRRIEQIRTRATRVDSGLRKSRDLPDDRKEKPRPPNGVRPYTWETPTPAPAEKPKQTLKSGPSTKTKKTDKEFNDSAGVKHKIASPMPDVINFERLDPQGCESDKNASCQTPKASQEESKDTCTSQSEQNTHKMKPSSTNEGACNLEQRANEQSDPLETDVIFMTQQAM